MQYGMGVAPVALAQHRRHTADRTALPLSGLCKAPQRNRIRFLVQRPIGLQYRPVIVPSRIATVSRIRILCADKDAATLRRCDKKLSNALVWLCDCGQSVLIRPIDRAGCRALNFRIAGSLARFDTVDPYQRFVRIADHLQRQIADLQHHILGVLSVLHRKKVKTLLQAFRQRNACAAIDRQFLRRKLHHTFHLLRIFADVLRAAHRRPNRKRLHGAHVLYRLLILGVPIDTNRGVNGFFIAVIHPKVNSGRGRGRKLLIIRG